MIAFWRALSVFAGTIIGVGIFGLPWVASKSGFLLLFFYLLILSLIAIVVHLIFGEICLLTKTKHRFPGYVRLYLGKRWGRIATISVCLGLFGAQLAYLIVGGSFLADLFSPYLGGGVLAYTFIFFAIGSLLVYRGIKSISFTEFLILVFFFVVLFLFLGKTLPFINLDNLGGLNLRFLFLPYGIVLFSLWGGSIIPEIKEMLGGERRLLRRVIISGIAIAVLTYLLFTAVIVGTSGQATTPDAFSGLTSKLGAGVIRIGYVFGVITCFSSFLTLGLTLKKVFWYDVNLSEKKSWAVASFVPFFFYLLGFKNFIDIIGLSGAITIGIEGVIMVILYKRFLRDRFSRTLHPAYYCLPLILIIGVMVEIIYFLTR